MSAESIRISLNEQENVAGLLQVPASPSACYVLAHGAGAGMAHPFIADVADGLAERGIATLRYQFLFMERRSKSPDRPHNAHKAVTAAVQAAADLVPGMPLFAGGKSYGGRMTSQVQAASPLPGVLGLIFLGFPLHAIGKPSTDRAVHLSKISVPMLFLQGSRDALAELPTLTPVIEHLGPAAALSVFKHADHAFHVPIRSGTTDAQVMVEMLDGIAEWVDGVV
jgi:predicted alpha/beta-hydrolase family hydrolase